MSRIPLWWSLIIRRNCWSGFPTLSIPLILAMLVSACDMEAD
ncbi:MAG: hypothetical protein ABI766_04755 [Gemmatimonadales bacterium]